MNISPSLHLLVAGVVFAVSQGADAQTDQLDQLRQTYELEIQKVILPVDRQYGQALVRLQTSLVAANQLEEALEVKKEIERLKGKIAAALPSQPTPQQPSADKPAMVAISDKTESKFRWKGDHQRSPTEEGAFLLKGDAGETKMMQAEVDKLQETYPNGAMVRFKYKSSGFQGTGFRIRSDFPDLRQIRTINPTLIFDGEWHEYSNPFPPMGDQSRCFFQLTIDFSEGEILLKDIELIPH